VSTAPHLEPASPGALCPRCGRKLDLGADRCPFDNAPTVRCEANGFAPGSVLLGRYLLGEVIGRGGWGIVFRARDQRDGSDVAVKVLSPQHSRDPTSVTRFLREQRTIARLHHPHVVTQRDHGRTEHGLFITMELMIGRTLGAEIHRCAPLPFTRAARIGAQICEALYAAHSRGVIHRDLKPDNIFLIEGPSSADYAKVMDFGIAKLLLDDSDSGSARLIYGTPHYVSPEQARAEAIDGRSDLYSAGVSSPSLAKTRC
jgi:serine/threonine-protein kinase